MSKYTKPIVTTILGISACAQAQDALNTLAPITVVGSKERAFDITGSAAFIDSEDIRQQGYTNINRILAKVPGVYTRDETGFGNFPNISLRGGDGTRSEKITLMEDGILTAPAAYSAPAAYYSPKAGRMSGIEILKGSSQIQYGPQTTGGVINYLSTPIPDNTGYTPGSTSAKGGITPASGEKVPNFYWRSTYGSDNTFFNHAYYGDTIVTNAGKFGYLFEIHQQSSDGFRNLPGGDTGFDLVEPMLKLSWEPDTALKQRFEFKYGYTSFDADETYVGLTEQDLNSSPYRRYAGTQFDNIDTDHHRTYLKWLASPTEALNIQAAAYYNEFARNWYKIRRVDGRSIHEVLAEGNGGANYGTLTGSQAGTLGIRANDRQYKAYGFQLSGDYSLDTGSVAHTIGFGARWHKDEISRFQRDDTITADGLGGFAITSTGIPGSGGNRFQETEALAFWLKDDIVIGNLTLSPGIRYEHLDIHHIDYASDNTFTETANNSGNYDIFAPGIGFKYDLDDSNNVYGGVFKGFSVPGPRSYLRSDVREETSIGYELGYRHRGDSVNFEITSFFTHFDNLISTDAGLGGSTSENAGDAEVYGIEALVTYDYAESQGYAFNLPMYISATWTSAELKSSLASGGGDDIYAGATPGSNIPYIPEWKIAAGVGYSNDIWGVNLDATYTSSTFGTANNFGSPDDSSRQGRIDSALLFDLSAHYKVTENVKLVGGIQNIFEEVYTTSRIPEGPRVGAPRTAYVGFEMQF